MKPKKAKDVITELASELDLNEDLVGDIVRFFWNDVHHALSELRHHNISVRDFGTFRVKNKPLNRTIDKYEKISSRIVPNTFRNAGRFNMVKQKTDALKRIRKMLDDEKIRQLEIKKRKQDA